VVGLDLPRLDDVRVVAKPIKELGSVGLWIDGLQLRVLYKGLSFRCDSGFGGMSRLWLPSQMPAISVSGPRFLSVWTSIFDGSVKMSPGLRILLVLPSCVRDTIHGPEARGAGLRIAKRLPIEERREQLAKAILHFAWLAESAVEKRLESLLRFRPRQRGRKGVEGVEEAVDRWQRDLVNEILRCRDRRRSKEAIRRASTSTKPSSSESGRARLTYPYRSAVSPSKSLARE